MVEICISNTSTLVTDAELLAWLPDIQTQITRDFYPAWGIDARLVMSASPEAGAYRVILKDDADDPADLGFHLDDNGIPEARIFCRPTIADGDTISSVLSHELLEMLADPTASRMAPDNSHIIEVADPVEQNGYLIGVTYVSNFVFPAYFGLSVGGKYDFNGSPGFGACPSMLPGGYLMRYDPVSGQWQSTFARRIEGTIPYQAIKQSGRSSFRAARGAPSA